MRDGAFASIQAHEQIREFVPLAVLPPGIGESLRSRAPRVARDKIALTVRAVQDLVDLRSHGCRVPPVRIRPVTSESRRREVEAIGRYTVLHFSSIHPV
jgi:hypothetical protein